MSTLTSFDDSRKVWFFPYTGAAVVGFGGFLHITRLAIGQEAFVRTFTSNVDLVLFAPMLYTAVGMLVFRKRVQHARRWQSIVFTVITAYFWLSVPIHLRAQIVQSNDFVGMTPWWYSVVLMPWLAVQLYVFLTTAVKPAERLAGGSVEYRRA
jgi:hypothetical protein